MEKVADRGPRSLDGSYGPVFDSHSDSSGGANKSEERLRKSAEETVAHFRSEIARLEDEISTYRSAIERFNSYPDIPPKMKEAIVGIHQDRIDSAKKQIEELRSNISALQGEVKEEIQNHKTLESMLETGDLEGALMMVQSNRVASLDRQIAGRIKELQLRNEKIQTLNNKLATLSGDDNHAERTRVKGDIDKLNADTQLDTIKLNSLVSKRGNALEMLNNLLQKLQKVLDTIISSMR